MVKFRHFMEKTQPVYVEGFGTSRTQLQFQITQPMANLLSLIPGSESGLRASALNWLITEGLMKASKGREKLTAMVNEIIAGQITEPIPLPKPLPKAVQPSKKVSGMRMEMARSVYEYPGRDPEETIVQPQDLFSPEAWARMPELRTVKVHGLSIPDYYDQQFEPKSMMIDGYTFNLRKMREVLEAHGLKAFRYGGFDGYIQFMEKGDYLPDEERLSVYDPNGQQGPDLRPYKQPYAANAGGNPTYNFVGGSSTAEEKRAEEAIAGMRRSFNQIAANIQANKKVDLPPDEVAAIMDLINTKKKLEKVEMELTGKGAGKLGAARKMNIPSPRMGTEWTVTPDIDMNLLMDLLRTGLAQPRKGKANTWGNPDALGQHEFTGDVLTYQLSPEQQERVFNAFMQKAGEGIVRLKVAASKVIPEAKPGANNDFSLSGLVSAALAANPEVSQKIKHVFWKMKGMSPKDFVRETQFDHIPIQPENEEYDNVLTHLRQSGYNWKLMPEEKVSRDILRNGQVVGKTTPGVVDWNWRKTKKGYAILEFGHSQFRAVYNAEKDQWELLVPQDRTRKTDLVQDVANLRKGNTRAEVDPLNPRDPILLDLINKGFEWSLISSAEQESRRPDWSRRNWANLSRGGVQYKVEQEPSDGKYYISRDTGAVEPAKFGATGQAWLGGGPTLTGGIGGGHVTSTPAGKKAQSQLEKMLLNGELGERGGPHANLLELPSVKDGVGRAIKYYNNKRMAGLGGKSKESGPALDHFEYGQLLSWGVEALRAFMGNRAFQVGYLTQAELPKAVFSMGDEAETELFDPGKGKGINALLLRAAEKYPELEELLDDPETHSMLINTLLDEIGKSPIIDLDNVENKVNQALHDEPHIAYAIMGALREALGVNAFEARKRFIANYVMAKMTREFERSIEGKGGMVSHGKTQQMSQIATGGEGEDEGGEDLDAPQVRGQDGFDFGDEEKAIVDPEEVLDKYYGDLSQLIRGASGAKSPVMTAGGAQPAPTPAPATTAKPAPTPAPAVIPTTPSPEMQSKIAGLLSGKLAAPAVTPTTPSPEMQSKIAGLFRAAKEIKKEGLMNLELWRRLKLREMGVVFDPKQKPHDGCGWNWQGAPGKIAVSIAGEADTAKTDPIGKKGNSRGRKKK